MGKGTTKNLQPIRIHHNIYKEEQGIHGDGSQTANKVRGKLFTSITKDLCGVI